VTAADEPELIDVAAQAIAQGIEVAQAYHAAAGRKPGAGLAVDLPSYPIASLPPVQGLGYAAGAEPAPAPAGQQ
jgi:hypothetical protein